MSRSAKAVAGLILLAMFLGVVAGCGKGNAPAATGVVSSVTLSPGNASLDPGQVVQMSAAALDANGKAVAGQAFTFNSNSASIQIANGGQLCAGTWDSLTAPVVCTPVASVPATADITATASGVTSPSSFVFVHLHVDSILVAPNPNPGCTSQTKVQTFAGHAFTNTATYNGAPNSCGGTTPCDITSTVGPFSWLSSNTGVATIVTDTANTTEGDATAKNPGTTTIAASVAGTTSSPTTFTTCGPKFIHINVTGQPLQTSFTVAAPNTQALDVAVVDINNTLLQGVPVTWSSSSTFVAAVSNAGVVTGRFPGQSTIIASCTPPACNDVVNQPIYSNPVLATVTGTAPSQNVFVSSTQFATTLPGCNNAGAATSCTSAIPIPTDKNTPGTAITLPGNQVPNSIGTDPAGANLFLGSSGGLLQLNPAGLSFTANITAAPGTLLTVSQNGKALVANAGTIQLFDPSKGTDIGQVLSGATAADFTPDSYKSFVAAGTSLFEFTPGLSLRTVTTTLPGAASGVAFLAAGSYGYVAGQPTDVTVFAACDNSQQDQITTLPGAPAAVRAVPNGTQMVAVDASNLDVINVTPSPATGCPTGVGDTVTSIPLGVTYGTIHQLLVTPDGTKAVVLGDKGVTIVALSGSPAPLNQPLGGATAFTGGITLDGALVYLGASDFKVHIVNLANGGDTPIAVSFPNQTSPVVPDLVTVVP